MDDLGVPWKRRSRQVEGRRTEQRILKERGAVLHPNSGAGSIKEDGHTDDFLYEVKDANKSFTLNGKELLVSIIRGIRQGRQARWVIYFTHYDITAEIHLSKGRRRG